MARIEDRGKDTVKAWPEWIRASSEGFLVLSVVVQPNAKKSEILQEYGGHLKVRIASPPVDGTANTELVRYLADILDLKAHQIHLLRGFQGRKKVLLIQSVEHQRVITGLSISLPKQGSQGTRGPC